MKDMTANLQASAELPTRFGDFRLHVFTDGNGTEHLAMVAGRPGDGCLVRLHSECATGDIMGSLRCDCRDQLELSLRKIAESGDGILIYIRDHEGRGIGLANKIKAYALQDGGMDTVDANVHLGFAADSRCYGAAVGILRHFGLKEIQLLTNNRLKIEALENAGIKVNRQVPLWTATNPNNEKYLATKRSKMGHIGS
jgi:GTP cyclohydrolase II